MLLFSLRFDLPVVPKSSVILALLKAHVVSEVQF